MFVLVTILYFVIAIITLVVSLVFLVKEDVENHPMIYEDSENYLSTYIKYESDYIILRILFISAIWPIFWPSLLLGNIGGRIIEFIGKKITTYLKKKA